MKEFALLFGELRQRRTLFFWGLLLVPLPPLFLLLQPWALKHAIDGPYTNQQWDQLFWYGVGVVALVVFEFALRAGLLSLFQYLGQMSLLSLRRRLVAHVLAQSPAYFDRTPLGVLLTRLTGDVEAVNDLFATGVVEVFLDALFVLGLSIFLFTFHSALAAVFVVVVPVSLVVMNYFRNRLRHWFNEIRNSMGLLNAFFEEAMRGIDTIQSFLVMPITISRFRKLHDRYLRATIRNNLYDCFLFGAMEALMSLAIAWLLFHGIHIYQGRFWFGPTAPLTLGTLVAFVEYSQKLFMPLKEFSGKMAVIQRSQVSLQRLRQVLEDHEELVPGSQKLATGNACVIRADRLSFRYQKSMTPALDDVTFTIRTGEMTALVGETGSGKTSITRLITRQYDGYDGSLTMNGCEVRDIELTNIRDNIAIVQQDPIVFTASLFDNVRLFKEHISEAQVQHALKRIHCEPWVNALPQGIHTLVGAQGVQLSAGQTQLLQLARLFVFPARLVVMDEATSQVDTLTEELIQRALAEVFRSFTSIVVAHRLSTILHANNILVLKNARLVEQGTHAHLLAANGTYASLYRKQFEEHAPPDAAESTSAVPLSQGR